MTGRGAPPRAPGAPAPRRAGRGALLIAVAAVALRFWHIGHGLPDFVEEAIPFKRAFEMWGWDRGRPDLNPHLFHYPALTFYLHFLLQALHVGVGRALGWFGSPADYFLRFQLDPTSMVVLARLFGVIADAATVLGVAAIGERERRGAGWLAAALVALAPVMILDARAIYVDPVMTALAVWALERLLAYRREGGRAALAAAVALIGLAAGAKYPAALLVVPLAWVLVERHGWRGGVMWAGAAAAAGLVFLLTSPYTLLDARAFWADVSQLAGFARGGHLGNLERPAFGYYAVDLARELGWAGTGLLAVSLALTIADARHRTVALTTWLVLLAFGIPISLGRLEAERYLVPIVPAAALLAAWAGLDLAARVRPAWRAGVAAALAVALLAPVAWRGVAAAASGAGSTQLAARHWLEGHLGPSDLLIEEAYGARLLTEAEQRAVSRRKAFAVADTVLQRAFMARPWFHVVSLPLIVLGHATVTGRASGGAPATIELFPHMVDLNQVFYEPALCVGADYVLTSGTVRGRYEEDSVRFAVQHRLYGLLDRHATRDAEFRSSRTVEGPEIVIYRITDSTRAAARAANAAAGGPPDGAALDPLWWIAALPPASRRWVAEQATPPGEAVSEAPRTPEGSVAPWVASLRGVFEELVRPHVIELAHELIEAGRYREARELALGVLATVPDDLQACRMLLLCASRTGDRRGTLEAIPPVLARHDPGGGRLPDLELEYAMLLARAGETARAREQVERVRAQAPAGSALARDAEAMLRALGPSRPPPR